MVDIVRPPWAALPVMLVASFLFATDAFIVNIALPTIGRTLSASPAMLVLIVAGYATAYACCLIAGGRLGDAFGRRRLFLWGMAAFVVASAGCGLAPSIAVLVGARLAQGIVAAAMVPQVLATVQALFHGSDRVRALGVFGAVIGSATVTGQVLGGAVVSADIAGLGWRPAFLINVPIGLVGIVIGRRLIPETRAERSPRLDVVGALLLMVAVLLVILPLSLGRDMRWPWWCLACLACAPLAWTAFLRAQLRSERTGHSPLLPPTLLSFAGMRRGLSTQLSYFIGVGGFLITTAISLQTGLRLGPLAAGLMLVPYAAAFLGGSLCVRPLVARHGRLIIVCGAVGLTVGLFVFAIEALLSYSQLSAAELAAPLVLIGAGQAFVMIPLLGAILAGVPADLAGAASGVLTTTQQIGIALGAAVLGTVLFDIADPASGSPRWGSATAVVLGVEGLLAITTAVLAGFLPSGGAPPRQRPQQR